jgi:hypothetical protein
MNEELAAELARMVEADQGVRRPPPGGRMAKSRASPEEHLEMNRIDVANADRLREIIDEHGWPGCSLVGDEGANNAWCLTQHASLDLQRRALELLRRAVAAGEATPKQLAYLTDRVRIKEGRKQLYGTQMLGSESEGPMPWPVEDPHNLDRRRAAVGLEPFTDYARPIGLMFRGTKVAERRLGQSS